MSLYFNLLTAKKKSGLKSLVIAIDAETPKDCGPIISFLAKAAKIDLSNFLKPITTDTPMNDDLPQENEFCDSWCDKYSLSEDKKTWELISPPATDINSASNDTDDGGLTIVSAMSQLESRFASAWLFPCVRRLTRSDLKAVITLKSDTNNTFFQNALLAVRDETFVRGANSKQLEALAQGMKDAFLVSNKPAELGCICNFVKEWCLCAANYLNADADDYENALAAIVEAYSNKTKTTTSTGAMLGTPIRLSDDVLHSPIFLKKVIAYALQPANGYDLLSPPKSVVERAEELMTDRDVTDWYNALSETPGILALHPDFTFACIQAAPIAITSDKGKLREYISQNLGVVKPAERKTDDETVRMDRVVNWANGTANVVPGEFGNYVDTGIESTTTATNDVKKTEIETIDADSSGEIKQLGNGKYDVSAIFDSKPLAQTESKYFSDRAAHITSVVAATLAGESDFASETEFAEMMGAANVASDELVNSLPLEIEAAEGSSSISDDWISCLVLDLFDHSPTFISAGEERVDYLKTRIATFIKEAADLDQLKNKESEAAKFAVLPTPTELRLQAIEDELSRFRAFGDALYSLLFGSRKQ